MSDLEESDIEDNEISKDNYDDIDESKKIKEKSKISKKLLNELKVDSEDEDEEDDDDEVQGDADIDIDEIEENDEDDDDDVDEDLIGLEESELQKLTIDKKDTVLLNEETYTEEISPVNSDVESDDENFLQKLDEDMRESYVNKNHPDSLLLNSVEIENLCKITRDKDNNIIDDNHKTAPFLSKFEKTKVIGQRIKQLNIGDRPFINVDRSVIDNSIIAEQELVEKKLPFIIRRPISNKKSEYWHLEDLEIIN